jgi:hypothetical protein
MAATMPYGRPLLTWDTGPVAVSKWGVDLAVGIGDADRALIGH